MHQLGMVGVIVDVHRHRPALLHAQQRPGELPIMGGGRDDRVWREFDQKAADAQGVVGSGRCSVGRGGGGGGGGGEGAELEEVASLDVRVRWIHAVSVIRDRVRPTVT